MWTHVYRSHRLVACVGAALLLGLGAPARAVDGVLEINQACAVNTGCFSGDTAGFPVTITQPGNPQLGSYRLTSNLTVTGNSTAITQVGGVDDHVTLDRNGFTIDGAGSTNSGIQLAGGDNWEIRNGTVKGFGSGIQQSSPSTGNRIIGVRVSGNTNQGIILSGDGHLVQDCTVTGNGGTGISSSANSRVVGNNVFNNGAAGISAGPGSAVIGNAVSNNAGTGISGGRNVIDNVSDGNVIGIGVDLGATVQRNAVLNNTDTGIQLLNTGSSVIDNTVYGSGRHGIDALQGSARVHGNVVLDAAMRGIDCTPYCTVSDNTVRNSGDTGIVAQTGVVMGNTVTGSGVHGISGGGSTVTNNVSSENTSNGLSGSAATGYGNNVFNGNNGGGIQVFSGWEIDSNVCQFDLVCP